MINIKICGKMILSATLYYGGFVNILRSLKKESIILCYHRILPSDSPERYYSQPGMYVTLETFEKHLSYLSRNYNIISIENILQERISPNTCILTFDDGWADNYKYAFPLLKRYKIPATIFLATNKVGTNEWLWTDKVCYSIHAAGVEKFIYIFKKGLVKLGINSTGIVEYVQSTAEASEQVLEFMKKLNPTTIGFLMDYLDNEIKYDMIGDNRPWLTWDEVMEMSQFGISFGAHTQNHVILTNMPLDDARSEILLSRNILSQRIHKPVKIFSYPNGYFDDKIINIINDSGYDIAVTTRRGSIEGSPSILNLNRIMIHEDMTSTIPMFACVLTGRIPYF